MKIGYTGLHMYSLTTEMLNLYVQRRAEDLIILTRSLRENTVDEFHRVGHQLSGNARNFGFPELEPLAQRMEELRPADLAQKGPAVLAEFKRWVDAKIA